MIVRSWYDLTRAVDNAVPCYKPVQRPPYGREDRCGDCDGCNDHAKVEEALMRVEAEFEQALIEAEGGKKEDRDGS